MGKYKRILADVINATLLLLGFAIAGYSWATTFSDIPPIFNDWRIGTGIGGLIFFVSALFFILKLYGNYLWTEPEIFVTPKVLDDYSDGMFYQNARLSIYNNEQIEITDCFATLISVSDYIEHSRRIMKDRKASGQRLRWSQSGFSNEKCELTIPPKDSREINLAHTKRNLEYLLCSKTISPNFMLGTRLFPVVIRIDGKFNGKAMKPLIFNGYLYNGNELFFKKGDWKRDKQIQLRMSGSRTIEENKQKSITQKNPKSKQK